jgi:dTDP-4-dehydrorhamnose reductase
MKKTMLIFGVSSFLGSNLAEFFKDEYRIIGTYFKNPVRIPGILCMPCDVLKKDMVNNIVHIFKPDVIIYAVGISSLVESKLNPKLADSLNTNGAVNCCMASERADSLFVYVSSAFVFSGEAVSFKESDTPMPLTTYGNIVSTTEFYIQRSSLYYLILRCCPLLGRSYSGRPNWFEVMQSNFARGNPTLADDSVLTGYLDVNVLARALKSLIEMEVHNRLIHISSSDTLTRYQLALNYAKLFKKDRALVHKVAGTFPLESRGKLGKAQNIHFQLDTGNLEQLLGVPMPSTETCLQLMKKRIALAG